MRNCLILGSGRSGTSLAAGLLSKGSYFMGGEPYDSDAGNPKGYFETWSINSINESLLSQAIPARPRLIGRICFRKRPPQGQRWLATLKTNPNFQCARVLLDRIAQMTTREPFCFKDPRFCYTLPVWRPFLRNTVILCVFRHPSTTAISMIKECQRVPAYSKFISNYPSAFRLWESVYGKVLDLHYPAGGEWLFLHYDQLLDGSAFERLRRTLEVEIDPHFADPELKRSLSDRELPENISLIYKRLCVLARYEERS